MMCRPPLLVLTGTMPLASGACHGVPPYPNILSPGFAIRFPVLAHTLSISKRDAGAATLKGRLPWLEAAIWAWN